MIVQPNFSQKEILSFLNEEIKKDFSFKEEDFLFKIKNYHKISIVNYLGLITMHIKFYDKQNEIAKITYFCQKSPDKFGLYIYDAIYYQITKKENIILSQNNFREWLMNISEFSEWLIWNQV
jgi:hypothetical protein